MSKHTSSRRNFIKSVGAGASALAISPVIAAESSSTILVDSAPRFELSPYLYMQFMEPLGTTDGSVAAAWNSFEDRWRNDVIDITRELGPALIRWGGCFSSYYRWKEAVGPRTDRKPMLNLCWGGVETNQVGTQEFVDFCTQTDADPLMSVNFESDGRKHWKTSPKGDVRNAGPEEAAEWVSFCNNPDDPLRKKYGIAQSCHIPIWQIGNETSYGRSEFDNEIAARRTVDFAKAMRRSDPNIQLIGWGDSGWGPRMAEIAGDHLQYIAFHHMFNPDRGLENSPLRGTQYRKDPAFTWERLMNAQKVHNARIQRVRDEMAGYRIPLAMTECHFALPGRNRCEVLSTWAAGVANARFLNVHQRHGDRLKIATLADFCGTRWQVNAVMIPVPHGQSFLMPVGLVMKLYRHHTGTQAIDVKSAPADLDVVASRTGKRVFLHVVNTNRTQSVKARWQIDGKKIKSGQVFEMAADPEFEVIGARPNEIPIVKRSTPQNAPWTFPAASVSAVELDVA